MTLPVAPAAGQMCVRVLDGRSPDDTRSHRASHLCCWCVVLVHLSDHCYVWYRAHPPPADPRPAASSYAEMLYPPSSHHHWQTNKHTHTDYYFSPPPYFFFPVWSEILLLKTNTNRPFLNISFETGFAYWIFHLKFCAQKMVEGTDLNDLKGHKMYVFIPCWQWNVSALRVNFPEQ